MRRAARSFTGVLLAAISLTGCAPQSTPASQPPESTSSSISHDCGQQPPSGKKLRGAWGRSYPKGSIHVSVTAAGAEAVCHTFDKSGNDDPLVPPDTLLFTFGSGGEGAQLELLVSDLVGSIVPPLDHQPLRTAPPLDGPINAQIGVSVGGVYLHDDQCALNVSKIVTKGFAGSFHCPHATADHDNPLDPTDEPSPDDSTAAQPSPTGTAVVSGWFAVSN